MKAPKKTLNEASFFSAMVRGRSCVVELGYFLHFGFPTIERIDLLTNINIECWKFLFLLLYKFIQFMFFELYYYRKYLFLCFFKENRSNFIVLDFLLYHIQSGLSINEKIY